MANAPTIETKARTTLATPNQRRNSWLSRLTIAVAPIRSNRPSRIAPKLIRHIVHQRCALAGPISMILVAVTP